MKMMVATMVTVVTHLWTQSLTVECTAFNMDFSLWLKYFPVFNNCHFRGILKTAVVFITNIVGNFKSLLAVY